MTNDTPVRVEQVDREAANDMLRRLQAYDIYLHQKSACLSDNGPVRQAFARRRLASTQEAYRMGFMRALYPRGWSEDDGADYDAMMCEDLASIATANAQLREACSGIAEDFMTSEGHHPGYVLIPTAVFERVADAVKPAWRDDLTTPPQPPVVKPGAEEALPGVLIEGEFMPVRVLVGSCVYLWQADAQITVDHAMAAQIAAALPTPAVADSAAGAGLDRENVAVFRDAEPGNVGTQGDAPRSDDCSAVTSGQAGTAGVIAPSVPRTRKGETIAGRNPGWAVEDVQTACRSAMDKTDAILALTTPASARTDGLVEAAKAALATMRHARVFIGSREKMHPDGQALYDADVAALAAALSADEAARKRVEP